ncbi:MAG: ABC transporter ATP-binding protein [Bacilli bacterium]
MMNDKTIKIEEVINDTEASKIKIRDFLRFFIYVFKKQKYNIIVYTFFLLFTASITPIFTYLWTKYIDYATIDLNFNASLIILIIYIGIKMLVEILNFLYLRILDKINYNSWLFLDRTINEKSSNIKYEFYENPAIQTKINQAWNFSHGEYVGLYQDMMYMLKIIFETIGIFISLFIINPIFSLICVVTIMPAFITNIIKNKINVLNNIKMSKFYTELNYYRNVLVNIDLLKDIYINDSFTLFKTKYNNLKNTIFDKEIIVERKIIKLETIEFLIRIFSLSMCILLIGYLTMSKKISFGALSASFTLITTLIFNFTGLIESIGSIIKMMYSIQQYNNLFKIDMVNKETIDVINDMEKISFSNVSYRYPFTNKYVIKGVNIEIKKGQKIAIVGANGSGKSTFIKLLLGVLSPSVGEIYVNSTNIQNMIKTSYWQSVSMVFQDYCKYKETLKYNVGISDSSNMNNDKEILESVRLANFTKDIGLDMILSKEYGGIELSGGEWQRLALARAIFKKGNIYILDEPNSAIDPIEETKFYKKIDNICKNDTCIFVTHRLGSVLFSDLVVFFEDGEVKEIGTHSDLVDAKGAYAKFWNSQKSQYK